MVQAVDLTTHLRPARLLERPDAEEPPEHAFMQRVEFEISRLAHEFEELLRRDVEERPDCGAGGKRQSRMHADAVPSLLTDGDLTVGRTQPKALGSEGLVLGIRTDARQVRA